MNTVLTEVIRLSGHSVIHRRRNRGGAEGALAPPILGIMCIKYAEFILDTPFGPPQSCLRSYASVIDFDQTNSGSTKRLQVLKLFAYCTQAD